MNPITNDVPSISARQAYADPKMALRPAKFKTLLRCFLAIFVLSFIAMWFGRHSVYRVSADDQVLPISSQQFDRLYSIVTPFPGEYAWRDEIPWQSRIQTARELAVAQDKPIFIIASANAFPLGQT